MLHGADHEADESCIVPGCPRAHEAAESGFIPHWHPSSEATEFSFYTAAHPTELPVPTFLPLTTLWVPNRTRRPHEPLPQFSGHLSCAAAVAALASLLAKACHCRNPESWRRPPDTMFARSPGSCPVTPDRLVGAGLEIASSAHGCEFASAAQRVGARETVRDIVSHGSSHSQGNPGTRTVTLTLPA